MIEGHALVETALGDVWFLLIILNRLFSLARDRNMVTALV